MKLIAMAALAAGASWITVASMPARAAQAQLTIVGNGGACNGAQYSGASPTAFSLSGACGGASQSTTSVAYLGATVSGSVVDGGGTQGTAHAQDTLWVSGGSGRGTLLYSVNLSGKFSMDCGGDGCEGSLGLTASDFGNNFQTGFVLPAAGSVSFSKTLAASKSFFFDQATTINYGFNVFEDAQTSQTVTQEGFSLQIMTPFVVLDANGHVLSGASIVSASGTDYLAPPVPEPSPLWLALAAAPLLSWRLRRR